MSDKYDNYSDDFISDDDDTRRAPRDRGRQGFKNNSRAHQRNDIDMSPLKMNARRKDSVDFWATPRGLDADPTRPTSQTFVRYDHDSRDDETDTVNLAFPQNAMLHTHTSRLTLSRGLTHTKTPASHTNGERTEPIAHADRGLIQAPVPGRHRSEVQPGEGDKFKKSHLILPLRDRRGIGTNPPSSIYPAYGRSKPTAKSRGRGRGRGRGGPSQRTSPRLDNVMQRMLSANRIKINELHNHTADQNLMIKDLKDENKLYKKMQYRQEKALNKFEDQESDLPRLILKHNNEVRALHEHLKAAREKYVKTDRYLRDAEDDLERANTKLKKYKALAQDKNLPERDELNRKLSKIDLDMEEKDNKIKELQRHIDHLSKNHRHELGVEIARHRETKRQLDQMKEDKESLDNRLKEKEKELEIKNIYSNRVMRTPHKLPASYSGTPLDSPPPHRRRIPSVTEMSAREKAKLFEMRRREDMKKNRPKPREMFENRNSSLEEERNHLMLEDREQEFREQERERERQHERERERELERARERDEERDRQEREREEEDHLRTRERLKRESQEFEKRQRELKERDERNETENRQRDEQLDRERREMEERFQKDRESEVVERQKQELDAREEREREIRNCAEEERQRIENDPRRIEEQRKKDLLLARLKAIDAGGKGHVSPFEDDMSTTSSKKSYTFSRPVENLHNGKRSQEELSNPYDHRKNRMKGDGGYDPSFGSAGSSTLKGGGSSSKKPAKKAELMDELFGGQSRKANKDEEDAFFVTSDTKKKNSKRPSAFPWDDDSSGKHSATISRPRENSSTLFGGGAALVEDVSVSDKSKLLPRRNRHQSSTFSTKPAVSAVDNFEDDIEEVIL